VTQPVTSRMERGGLREAMKEGKYAVRCNRQGPSTAHSLRPSARSVTSLCEIESFVMFEHPDNISPNLLILGSRGELGGARGTKSAWFSSAFRQA
jgi:hypothetical protein